jgi:sec-independent protein translocase protein TatA
MPGDLFDSWWKVLIIAIIAVVLFGQKRLPGAARSLGQSMRILKREVQGLHEDDESAPGGSASAPASTATGFPAPAEITPPPPNQQSQIDALQQQIRDLQRAAAMDPAPAGAASEPHRSQQPS